MLYLIVKTCMQQQLIQVYRTHPGQELKLWSKILARSTPRSIKINDPMIFSLKNFFTVSLRC